MCKITSFCIALCLIVGSSWASTKIDPMSGQQSSGREQLSSIGKFFESGNALELELEALYAEAFARKSAGQADAEIWARINELDVLLNGRNVSSLDEGGETCTSAVQISSLPFCDTGNTMDNVNDYAPPAGSDCSSPNNQPGGTGKDVVYVYTPATTETISVSLCGSSFDTYLHIYRGCPGSDNAVQVCCNDDNNGCGSGSLRSCCPEVVLIGGETYYIIVDGWRENSAGNYQISMTYGGGCAPCPPPPCVVCPENGVHSIEPVCFNGYHDETNGGCFATEIPQFEVMLCNTVTCGTTGRYANDAGAQLNDVDYYMLTVDAESESLFVRVMINAAGNWGIFRIDPSNVCGDYQTIVYQQLDRCEEGGFLGCVPEGVYLVGIGSLGNVPCGTPYTIGLQCLDCPEVTGRCCYRTENGPACADEWTRDECAEVQGLWAEGETCEECCPTDFCTDWIEIPGVYEYVNTANSCCSVPVNFCVGEDGCGDDNCFAANRAVIYQFTIEDDAVMTLAAAGPGDNQIMVFTDCSDPTGSCVASADNATDNNGNQFQGAPEVLSDLALPAGTYFVATSHFFWQDFPCGEITLRIISDTPLPVDLLGFDATALDGAIKLSWSTASEDNSSHFNLLRDGAMLAQVTATNSPSGATYTWTDENLENGRSYNYSLVSVDLNGAQNVVGDVNAMPSADAATVNVFTLHQNFPNPFNPETMIAFDLPEAAATKLVVINALGQEVATLLNGQLDAGHHNVTFDGKSLPSGIYFYHLTAGDFTSLRKMVLLK